MQTFTLALVCKELGNKMSGGHTPETFNSVRKLGREGCAGKLGNLDYPTADRLEESSLD